MPLFNLGAFLNYIQKVIGW